MIATTHDIAAIRDALALIVAPGQVIELRVPSVGGRSNNTASGYFNDLDKAAAAAARFNGRDTVYMTLQHVNPDLFARAANRMKEYAKATTTDNDIIGRCFIGIDCDPQRPALISSTEEEHEAALERTRTVRDFLSELGWPDPIHADSGNGGHLLYAVDLPADDGGLTQRILKALAARFNDDRVKIDETVYNPARIWKVYGTFACKGDSTPDRPHRLARIIETPERFAAVPAELLEELAAIVPANPSNPASDRPQPGTRRVAAFDVEAYLREHGVGFRDPVPYIGGQKWMLDTCVWNGHTDHAAIVIQRADGSLGANCSHNSCEGKGWKDLRDALEGPQWREEQAAKQRGFEERQQAWQERRRAPDVAPADDAASDASLWMLATDAWPDPLADEAYYGLAGEIVRAIEPHTESDPAAILIQLLIAVGNCVGRTPHFMAEADYHALNLFGVLVGQSSRGRKGTSWEHVRRLFDTVDHHWAGTRILDGLSSGEGLIHQVRDPLRTESKGEETITDTGVLDKRLLVQAPEFASVLKVQGRDGSTLSGVLRTAWDRGVLRVMTRKDPLVATGAHISIIGHVTRDELLRLFDDTDAANGYGNRFLWFAVRRSKLLPLGGRISDVDFTPMTKRLAEAIYHARTTGELRRDDAATAMWCDVYPLLSADRPGLFGAMTARAEPIVMRLACIYAVLDQSRVLRTEHLMAALAVWAYSEQSARWIFGDRLGDPVADEILRALRATATGMSRTDISDLFGRNRNTARITGALHSLEALNLAKCEQIRPESGQGRNIEQWHAVRS